jgi:hypothetical protein
MNADGMIYFLAGVAIGAIGALLVLERKRGGCGCNGKAAAPPPILTLTTEAAPPPPAADVPCLTCIV